MSNLFLVGSGVPDGNTTGAFYINRNRLYYENSELDLIKDLVTRGDAIESCNNKFLSSFPAVMLLSQPNIPDSTGSTIREPIQLVSMVIDKDQNDGLIKCGLLVSNNSLMEFHPIDWVAGDSTGDPTVDQNLETYYNECRTLITDIESLSNHGQDYLELVRDGDISDYISIKTLLNSYRITIKDIYDLRDMILSGSVTEEWREKLRSLMEYIPMNPGEDQVMYINRVVSGIISANIIPENRVIGNMYPIKYESLSDDDYVYYISDTELILTKPIIKSGSMIDLEITYNLHEDEDNVYKISQYIIVKPSIITIGDKFKLQITDETITLYPIIVTQDVITGPKEYFISSCKLSL